VHDRSRRDSRLRLAEHLAAAVAVDADRDDHRPIEGDWPYLWVDAREKVKAFLSLGLAHVLLKWQRGKIEDDRIEPGPGGFYGVRQRMGLTIKARTSPEAATFSYRVFSA
jgi:hypothetical protein